MLPSPFRRQWLRWSIRRWAIEIPHLHRIRTQYDGVIGKGGRVVYTYGINGRALINSFGCAFWALPPSESVAEAVQVMTSVGLMVYRTDRYQSLWSVLWSRCHSYETAASGSVTVAGVRLSSLYVVLAGAPLILEMTGSVFSTVIEDVEVMLSLLESVAEAVHAMISPTSVSEEETV